MGKDLSMSKSMLKAGITLKSDHAVQSLAQLISEYLLKWKHYKLSGLLPNTPSRWSWAIELSLLHHMHSPSFPFTTLTLETAITPSTCPGVGDHGSDSPSPVPGKHSSPGPHSHIPFSSPQPHSLLPNSSGFGTLLDLLSSYLWPLVGFNLSHQLRPPLVHPLAETATDHMVSSPTGWSDPEPTIPTCHPSPQPKPAHIPWCTILAAGHSNISGASAALTEAPLPLTTVLGIYSRHSFCPFCSCQLVHKWWSSACPKAVFLCRAALPRPHHFVFPHFNSLSCKLQISTCLFNLHSHLTLNYALPCLSTPQSGLTCRFS